MKKFMQNIKALLCAISTFLALPALAVIPQIEVWSNGTNFRYLLKDYHRDYADCAKSIKQQADIIWAAQLCKKQGVFVLAEDCMAYIGANKKIQKKICKNNSATLQKHINYKSMKIGNCTPLSYLIKSCNINEIACYNTDCYQVFRAIEHSSQLPHAKRVSPEEALIDLSENAAQVASNLFVKDMYTLFIKKFDTLKNAWEKHKNEKTFSENFLNARNLLVDITTVHKLSQWNQVKHGFICEGQIHIEGIKERLAALKYIKIHNFGTDCLWDLPYITPQEQIASDKSILGNTLDLRKIFTELFIQQKLLKPTEALKLAALKEPTADPTFMSSAHGQKYLAETQMNDGNQTAAAPAVVHERYVPPFINGASVSMMRDN